jgi:hypothetical protein
LKKATFLALVLMLSSHHHFKTDTVVLKNGECQQEHCSSCRSQKHRSQDGVVDFPHDGISRSVACARRILVLSGLISDAIQTQTVLSPISVLCTNKKITNNELRIT